MEPLPWEMIGATAGILSFILMLFVEWNRLGTMRRIIVPLFVGIAAYFFVYYVVPRLFSPQEISPAEDSPVATPGNSTVITVSYFSDNFNSGTEFNQEVWRDFEAGDCSVRQRNNQIEFSSTGINDTKSACMVGTSEILFEEAGSMEASFRTSHAGFGDLSNSAIEFSKGTFDKGAKSWVIECGIMQIPSQKQVLLFFNLNSNYPQEESEEFITVPAATDRWYRMKLEIVPQSDKVICYADDKIIGAYEGAKLAELHNEKIDRKLLGFWTPNSQAVFYADNVILLPPK